MHSGPTNGHEPWAIDLKEYLDGLYSYALVLSRNSAEAEDLVQETCLRALRAMDRLRRDSNVKSWLFTILRNVWLNQIRQRKTAPDMLELDTDEHTADRAVDSSKDPFAAYVSDWEREQVRHAIEQLPVEFREVILLREYEELSYEEIAGMLQCPVGTVMSRLARARAKLRDLISTGALASEETKASRAGDIEARDMRESG
jgi:RNA polymerase sigma-70 factor, ECF subfamily